MHSTLQYKKTNIPCQKCGKNLRKEITYNKETGQIMISLGCECGFAVAATSDRHQRNNVGDGAKLIRAVAETLEYSEEILSGN